MKSMRFFIILSAFLIAFQGYARSEERGVPMKITVTSSAFKEGGMIPSKYTCDGDEISPPLDWSDVPAATKSLALISDDPDAPIQGINSSHRTGYGGPCPPSGVHRYFFKVYALDVKLSLGPGAAKKDLEKAMSGHVLGEGQLMGRYKR